MKMPTQNEIAEFVKESVEWLKENHDGCSMMDMPNGLCIVVGWSEGFDDDAPNMIVEDGYAIFCGVKLNNSDMKTDYDIDFAYLYNVEDKLSPIIDNYAIRPRENYNRLAGILLDDYKTVENLEWDEDGGVSLLED